MCRRQITLAKRTNTVEVVDSVSGDGRRRVESRLHLAPGCKATLAGDTEVELCGGGRRLRITFSGADAVNVAEDWVSESYGVRVPAPVVTAVTEAELPLSLNYEIAPA